MRNVQYKTLQTTFDIFNHLQNLLHKVHKCLGFFALLLFLKQKVSYNENITHFLLFLMLKSLNKNVRIIKIFYKLHIYIKAVTIFSNGIFITMKLVITNND